MVSSSAECSLDKPLCSLVSGHDSTICDIVWVSLQEHWLESIEAPQRHYHYAMPPQMSSIPGHTYPHARETRKENKCCHDRCLTSKVQDQSTLTNRMLLCCSEIGASKLGLPRLEVAATFSVIIHGRRVTSTTATHTQSA